MGLDKQETNRLSMKKLDTGRMSIVEPLVVYVVVTIIST
jgi:hypothetical protein